MFQCSECSKVYSLKKNLYHHMRVKHGSRPPLPPGKITCPLTECQEKSRTHKELRTHLEVHHKETLECEELEFADYETFEDWKKQLAFSDGSGYIRRISEKVLKTKGEAKTHYICHRSGVCRSEPTIQRQRRVVSSKIGATCPSVMEVTRSLIDGTVRVLYWKTHFGHSTERAPLRRVLRRRQEMISFSVCVIIPAAGTGERMGADLPKQYIPIHQKPIICYTVEAFLRLAYVKKVVVVAASDSLDLMLRTLTQQCSLQGDKLMITEGSGSRHQSIQSGLRAIQTCCDPQPEVVVVHDGVRPFFPEEIVVDVVLAAKQHGAAGLTCPLVSTVVSADEKGFLDTSLDRSQFRASEMPQAFNYELFCKAYQRCSAEDLEHGTECLHLMQKYADVNAKLLPGTSHLWKVTHHKDIYTATAVLKETQSVCIISGSAWPILSAYLETFLSKTFKSVHPVSKLSESSVSKHPNLVQLQDDDNPYNLLEQLEVLAQGQKMPQLTTMVQVFMNRMEPTVNFTEFQEQAVRCAKSLKAVNVLVYLVQYRKSTEPFEKLAELVRSLLFDSNPNISGNLFLC